MGPVLGVRPEKIHAPGRLVMTESAWLAVLSSVPIGLQLGATGTGGAILSVPLMVYIARIPVQQAAAMSLVIVAGSALFGFIRR
jgi:uncharacterized membrane protein YfcA